MNNTTLALLKIAKFTVNAFFHDLGVKSEVRDDILMMLDKAAFDYEQAFANYGTEEETTTFEEM